MCVEVFWWSCVMDLHSEKSEAADLSSSLSCCLQTAAGSELEEKLPTLFRAAVDTIFTHTNLLINADCFADILPKLQKHCFDADLKSLWGALNRFWICLNLILMSHILPPSANETIGEQFGDYFLSVTMSLPGPLTQQKHYETLSNTTWCQQGGDTKTFCPPTFGC